MRLSEDATKELREFVEELTDIARSGQSISIVSGFHIAWWGTVVTLACLLNLLAVEYGLPLKDQYIWPVTMLAGWLGSRYIRGKLRRSKRAGKLAFANQVTQRVWMAIGIAATVVILTEASQIVSFAGRGYFIIFVLCALGLITTASVTNEPLLILSGAGWFLVGGGSLFLPPSTELIYAATIIASIIFLVVPGLVIGVRQS